MAYQTGSATSIDDLIDKLVTFATGLSTTPWTLENSGLGYDWCTLSRGGCYVSFRWGAAGTGLAVYQSIGYGATDAQDPTINTGDSGNGAFTTVPTERQVNFTDGNLNANPGPYTAYHFFAGEGDEPYVYVVVESASGVFRHFGFGNLVKSNDFTGGEFAYGHLWSQNTSYVDSPSNTFSDFLLDMMHVSSSEDAATMHLEGLPGQGASDKWGVFSGDGAPGNDGDGNPRVPLSGSSRSGLYGYHLSWMQMSQMSAYKLLVPIVALYRDTTTSPDTWYWLGEMPGVAIVNMANFSPGDEITVGSDTYVVFPWVRKQFTPPSGGDVEESRNAGVAYKKVV